MRICFLSGSFIVAFAMLLSLIGVGVVNAQELHAERSPYLTVQQFEQDVEVLREQFLRFAEAEGATVLQDEDFDFWIHEYVYHMFRARGITIMGEPEFLNRE